MVRAKGSRDLRRVALTTAVGLTVTVVLAAVLIDLSVLIDRLPRALVWRAKELFLMAAEAVYGLTLLIALIATPLLITALHRARRTRTARPILARCLALGVSVVTGALVLESGAAVWNARVRRFSAIPVGGFTTRTGMKEALPAATPERVALPTRFALPNENHVVNVTVVGESSAVGVPYHHHLSLGDVVAWQLNTLIPGKRFHFERIAESGDSLERQQKLLAKTEWRPDVLIIYCGHNEFSARLHATREVRHYVDQAPPTAWQTFVERVERASPFCGMIGRETAKCRVSIPPSGPVRRPLVDVPQYTEEERSVLLSDFRRRLEEIVAWADAIGAITVLIAPPANDSGLEPNRSILPASTPYSERKAFARDFVDARRMEEGDPDNALARYRALMSRQPGFAATHYRVSRLLQRAEDWEGAYREAVLARDLDAQPLRCPTAFQNVYREVASRHDTILIDGQNYFHALGWHGLLDDRLFHDAMHPSLRGHLALAQAVLRGLRARRAFGWPEDAPEPRLDPAECVAHYGLKPKDWVWICRHGIRVYEALGRWYYDPRMRESKRLTLESTAAQIENGCKPEEAGIPNIGTPAPVPLVPEAFVAHSRAALGIRTASPMP